MTNTLKEKLKKIQDALQVEFADQIGQEVYKVKIWEQGQSALSDDGNEIALHIDQSLSYVELSQRVTTFHEVINRFVPCEINDVRLRTAYAPEWDFGGYTIALSYTLAA